MDVTSPAANQRYERITKALEWPMALLALAVIPALLLDNGSATPMTHAVANAVNWFVWVAFCTEFAFRLSAAPERGTFLRKSWFDIFIIVVSPPFGVPQTLQGLRALRAVRLLRLLRLMRGDCISEHRAEVCPSRSATPEVPLRAVADRRCDGVGRDRTLHGRAPRQFLSEVI